MKRTNRGRDHRKSAPFNAHLAPWGFVDDAGTVITKGGDLFVVYRVTGVDYECLDHEERREVVRRFEAALRVLSEEHRLYQYVQKRRMPTISAGHVSHPVVNEAVHRRVDHINGRRGELFEVQIYAALVYEGFRRRVRTAGPKSTSWSDRLSIMRWLSPSTRLEIIEGQLDQSLCELRNAADDWENQLADSVRPERLGKSETFQFLRTLVNFSPATTLAGGEPPTDTHLDYFIADSHVEQFHTHLVVQDSRVQVLSMKHPPRQTHAHTLQRLFAVPAELSRVWN